MNPKYLSLAALCILTWLTASHAHAESIHIKDAWVRMMPPSSKATAAYFSLTNDQDKSITLESITTDSASTVQIHKTVRTKDSAMMQHQPSLTIPPKQTVTLSPGGLHLMIMGLKQPLKDGEQMNLVLHFSDQKTLQIRLPIKRQTF